MKLSTIALSFLLMLAVAGEAAAQRRATFWFSATPPPVSPPLVTYSAPYWQQSHWIYGYMLYGYDGFGYSQAPSAVQYGYLPQTFSAPVRDYGPPARSRSSQYPALRYSDFAAEEQERASSRRGYITVTVPNADAKVWINGQLMTQTGIERTFMTPMLESTAKAYGFDVKVSWTDNIGSREQQLPTALQIRAGETQNVVFPLNVKK